MFDYFVGVGESRYDFLNLRSFMGFKKASEQGSL
jgi:hypothetical protein